MNSKLVDLVETLHVVVRAIERDAGRERRLVEPAPSPVGVCLRRRVAQLDEYPRRRSRRRRPYDERDLRACIVRIEFRDVIAALPVVGDHRATALDRRPVAAVDGEIRIVLWTRDEGIALGGFQRHVVDAAPNDLHRKMSRCVRADMEVDRVAGSGRRRGRIALDCCHRSPASGSRRMTIPPNGPCAFEDPAQAVSRRRVTGPPSNVRPMTTPEQDIAAQADRGAAGRLHARQPQRRLGRQRHRSRLRDHLPVRQERVVGPGVSARPSDMQRAACARRRRASGRPSRDASRPSCS